MAVREWINQHPKAGIVVGVVTVFASVLVLFLEMYPRSHSTKAPEEVYFTIDNGATYFSDNAANLPPFDHDGKEAVRAFVVTTDGGSHKWVAYLGKYSPEVLQKLRSSDQGVDLHNMRGHAPTADPRNMLLKAPGSSTEWTPMAHVDFAKLIIPPPGMGDGPIQPVYP